MLRFLVCGLAGSILTLGCGEADHPPKIDLDKATTSVGGAPDDEPDDGSSSSEGGKKGTEQDLRKGGFLNLPQVSDILYDDLREVLYVGTTQGGLATVTLSNSKIHTQKIGDGPLLSLDLSPSGNRLSICENTITEDMQYFVHVADFASGSIQDFFFGQYYYLQEGTHGAAFADDDNLFLSTSFVASGYVPLYRLNVTNGESVELPAVVSDTMFARSLDNSTLVIAEPKDGTGPIHVVDTTTLEIVDGTVSETLHDVAINTDATILALPATGRLKLRKRDATGAYTIESVIEEADRDARAAIFSPVSNSIYVTWSKRLDGMAAFVERYNVDSLESEGTLQTGIKLADSREGGFPPTRMKISNDGRLLFVTVATGINVYAIEE